MRLVFLAVFLFTSAGFALSKEANFDDRATHRPTGIITIKGIDESFKINAFGLNQRGEIVAACGDGPGKVCVIDDDGNLVQSWDIDIKPEAITVAENGDIIVGGVGKIFCYDDQGNLIRTAASPHVKRLSSDNEELRRIAITNLEKSTGIVSIPALTASITQYETILVAIEANRAKGELTSFESAFLQALPQQIERLKVKLAKLKAQKEKEKENPDEEKSAEQSGPTEEEISEEIERMIQWKLKISSISSSPDYLFVSAQAIQGFGYELWRTDRDLSNGKIIIKGLVGCCGQMDVQCSDEGLFVAENSRFRVGHYDLDGKEISHWGKSDRTGIEGFGSCCNPMNVCFDKEGHVFTAESSVGRIKQFDASGQLISYIGAVDLVPGCENVSIAVSPVNDNIYMLDITRNHIKVMQPKPASDTGSTEEPAGTDSSPTNAEDSVDARVKIEEKSEAASSEVQSNLANEDKDAEDSSSTKPAKATTSESSN